MQTYLSKHWHQFPEEVWDKLFDFEMHDIVTVGELPDDLYFELSRVPFDYEVGRRKVEIAEIKKQLEDLYSKMFNHDWKSLEPQEVYTRQQIEELQGKIDVLENEIEDFTGSEILTNVDQTYKFLKNWHKEYTIKEEQSVKIIVQWHEILKELCGQHQRFVAHYISLVCEFLENRNLRYLLLESSGNIKLVFNPAVLFMERILALKDCCNKDENLKIYYEDFENDVCNLIDDISNSRKRSVLRVSSNLLEGSAKYAINKNGKSLSEIINNAPDNIFPHPSVKDTILSVYKFYCDYIGGRHSGNTSSRSLEQKDAILFGLISAIFSEYILNNN